MYQFVRLDFVVMVVVVGVELLFLNCCRLVVGRRRSNDMISPIDVTFVVDTGTYDATMDFTGTDDAAAVTLTRLAGRCSSSLQSSTTSFVVEVVGS